MNIPSHLLPTKLERGFEGYALSTKVLRTLPGVTAEMLVCPDFWVHLAARDLRIDHRIEVIAMDGTLDAELRVIAIDPRGHWAQMRVLRGWPARAWADMAEPDGPAERPAGQYPDKDGYVVEFDRVHKWRIMRGVELIAKDYPDEPTAVEALANIKAAKGKKAA